MNCFDCENCIEDYEGKPYCFVQQTSINKGNDDNVERLCFDFEPTKDARMSME